MPETDDELAKRRGKATAATAPASSRRKSGSKTDGKEKPPPLWRWFSTQVAHSDPTRAKAAIHVRERWNLPTVSFARIDRALVTEDSPHLLPFRLLLDEYRTAYQIDDGDDQFARETGMGGLLVPFAPEYCDSCSRPAIPGTGKCERHGGQWLTPQDIADLSRRLHDRLLSMGEAALRVLQDLMDNGRSEQVRMMAATSVLDRAGVGPHMNVNHTGEITVSASEQAAIELRARLDRIAINAASKAAIANQLEQPNLPIGDVVDAEVIEG